MSINNAKLLIRHAINIEDQKDKNAFLVLALDELSKAEGKLSILSSPFPIEIFRRYKGHTYRGQLLEGWKVGYQGNVFSSPSAAAVSISGHNENGWRLWRYFDAGTNKEYPINNLRSRE